MAYAEVVVSSSQATCKSLPISVLDLMPSRAGEPASSAICAVGGTGAARLSNWGFKPLLGGGTSLRSGTGLLSDADTDRTHRGGDQKNSGGSGGVMRQITHRLW